MEMGENGQRQIARDSLFVMAELRVDGMPGEVRVRVRNLSAGGLMAEGAIKLLRGQAVSVNVRNVGWVEGSVAWVQDNRCGIAFRDEINPRVARAPVAQNASAAQYGRSPLGNLDQGPLRKI